MNPTIRDDRRPPSKVEAPVGTQAVSVATCLIFSRTISPFLNAAALIILLGFASSVLAQSGTWTAKTPAPTSPGQIGVINGIIYGLDSNSVLESYNPATDTWTILPAMLTPRGNESVGVANGLLYALGGCLDNACSSFVATVEAYDPTTNAWSAKAPMPTARRNLGVGTINGILYAISGDQGPGSFPVDTVEAYNPSTNTWTAKAPIPTPRAAFGVAVVNGRLYAVGGYNDDGVAYATNEAYDPVSNSWSTKSSAPSGFAETGAADGLDGRVYFLSHASGIPLAAYNPATDSWAVQPSLPVASGPPVAAADGVLYAIGGDPNVNEAFTPGPTNQTPSAISTNFNGTAIAAQNVIWFNSVLTVHGLGNAPVTIFVTDSNMQFTSNGTSYTVSVPNSTITFSPTATSATTTFDSGSNSWNTTVPSSGLAGNTFLDGVAWMVPSGGLPGGIKNVTWRATFASVTHGITVQWKWGAAVYTSFTSDYGSVGVKPIDDNQASQYHNSDHAGTPENFKPFVIGGATGGGGSNWTGGYSGTASMTLP